MSVTRHAAAVEVVLKRHYPLQAHRGRHILDLEQMCMLQQPHICHTVNVGACLTTCICSPVRFHELVSEIKVYEDVADILSEPSGRLVILHPVW